MKRALVMSGGGARGAFQVGMLKELILNQGMDFEVIRGVSVGSLNAAFLAQASTEGNSLEALQERVRMLIHLWTQEITGNDSVYDGRFAGLAGLVAGADSLNSFEPLEELIARHVDVDALRTSGRDFEVGVVSLVSGLYDDVGPHKEHFLKYLLASSAIPVVFPFQVFEDDEEVLVDGGVRNVSPLGAAFKAEVDEIWVLLASRLLRTQPTDDGYPVPQSATLPETYEKWRDNWLGTKVGGFDVLVRTVDLLTDEVYLDDIRNALKWNRICEAVDDLDAGARGAMQSVLDAEKRSYVPLKIIAPRQWFDEDNQTNSSTEFEPDLIAKAIAHGEDVASEASSWFWPPVTAETDSGVLPL